MKYDISDANYTQTLFHLSVVCRRAEKHAAMFSREEVRADNKPG